MVKYDCKFNAFGGTMIEIGAIYQAEAGHKELPGFIRKWGI